jgi:multidrug efflux pump subunit AcrB
MTVALLTSLALALSWTPNLSQFFIKGRGEKNEAKNGAKNGAKNESEEWKADASDDAGAGDGNNAMRLLAAEEAHLSGFFLRVVNFHERWLRRALERPRALLALSLALIAVSYVCYRFSGSDLLPEMDEGGFVLDYLMPAGSSLAETNRVVSHIEQILRETPEVESTSRRTGLQLGLAAVTEANYGDVLVKLKGKRDRGIDEVIAEVRAKVRQQEPALDVEFTQVLQDMIGDLTSAPEPIQIKLFSEDPKLLAEWAPKVADAIGPDEKTKESKIKGVVDVLNGIDNTISGPSVTFRVDPSVAARAGFTVEEVALDASAILEGEPAPTPVVANDRAYTLRVRFPAANRASLEAMRDTLLVSSGGHTATLGGRATVVEDPGQT